MENKKQKTDKNVHKQPKSMNERKKKLENNEVNALNTEQQQQQQKDNKVEYDKQNKLTN